MPAAEQGMLDLGHSRQFWSQVLFQQVFNRTAPSLRENRSKILETNTKALRHTAIFQMHLNGSNPPKSRLCPITSSTLGQPELLSCLLQHHSSLQPLCVCLQQHLKALLCWLLSKWCHWAQELLPGAARAICMKFKDQMVGQPTKFLSLLTGSVNLATCCLSEVATEENLAENNPRLQNNTLCFFQLLKYGLADH